MAGVRLYADPADATIEQYMAPERTPLGVSSGVQTDSSGHFLISNTTAGQWKLTAWCEKPAEWENTYSYVVVGGQQDLTLTVVRRKHPLAELVAHVNPSVDGNRVDAVAASLFRVDGLPTKDFVQPQTAISESGNTVSAYAEPGTWRLWVMSAGGKRDYIDFDVAELDSGKRLERELTFRAPGDIQGTVVGASHGSVFVSLRGVRAPAEWSTDRRWWDRAGVQLECDADGGFRLGDVPAGSYEIRYENEQSAAACLSEVGGGAVTHVELIPALGVRVRFAQPEDRGPVCIELHYGDGLSCEAYVDHESGFDAALTLPPGVLRWDNWQATRSRFHFETIVQHGEAWRGAGEELVIDCHVDQG
jgi:hypothetical protein